MTLNASARRYRIWICKPGEDENSGLEVTDACSGEDGFFSVTDEPITEDGLLRTSGQLVLGIPYGQEDTYDTWENPDRWAIGNRILVKVVNTTGEWRWHPRSGLYILSHPAPAYPGNWQLQLEIGCNLSLLAYRQPNDNASGVTFGQGRSRGAIAASILNSVGLNCTGSISGSLNYPIPKTQSSFVQQAGAIAISGTAFLWQHRSGEIRAKAIDLVQRQRLFKHVVGVDDAGEFQPIQGSERPVSKFRVVGTGYELLEPNGEAIVTVDQQYDGEGRLIAVLRKTVVWNGNVYSEVIQEQRIRGEVIPDDVYQAIATGLGLKDYQPPDYYQLLYALNSTEVRVYEDSKEGRLLYISRTSEEPEGAVLADYWKKNPPRKGQGNPFENPLASLTQTMTSEKFLQVYGYDNSGDVDTVRRGNRDTAGQVRSIRITREEPRGKVAGAANDWAKNPFMDKRSLIVSDRTQESWSKLGPEEWLHQQIHQRAGQLRSGTIAGFSALRVAERKTDVSRSGDAQPPSAERCQPLKERKEVRYRGDARFASFSGAAYAPRTQLVTIDYLTSDAEAKTLAKTLGLMRMGRHQGMRIVSTLRDEWFDYEPLSRIDVAYNGYIYLGVTDLVTWTLAGNEALVQAELMQLGRAPIARGAADPYQPHTTPAIRLVAQVQQEFEIESSDEFDAKIYATRFNEVLPEKTADFETIAEFSAERAFDIEAVDEIAIVIPPILEVESVIEFSGELVQAETGRLRLVSHWPMESFSDFLFEDIQSDNDLLEESGTGTLAIVSGVQGNAARFRRRSVASSAAVFANNNVHWKLTFNLRFGDFSICLLRCTRRNSSGGSEWSLERYSADQMIFRVRTLQASRSSFDFEEIVSTVSITSNVWYAIELEVDPANSRFSFTVDGMVTAATLLGVPQAVADAALSIGAFGTNTTTNTVTFDEIKFYKEI